MGIRLGFKGFDSLHKYFFLHKELLLEEKAGYSGYFCLNIVLILITANELDSAAQDLVDMLATSHVFQITSDKIVTTGKSLPSVPYNIVKALLKVAFLNDLEIPAQHEKYVFSKDSTIVAQTHSFQYIVKIGQFDFA